MAVNWLSYCILHIFKLYMSPEKLLDFTCCVDLVTSNKIENRDKQDSISKCLFLLKFHSIRENPKNGTMQCASIR